MTEYIWIGLAVWFYLGSYHMTRAYVATNYNVSEPPYRVLYFWAPLVTPFACFLTFYCEFRLWIEERRRRGEPSILFIVSHWLYGHRIWLIFWSIIATVGLCLYWDWLDYSA